MWFNAIKSSREPTVVFYTVSSKPIQHLSPTMEVMKMSPPNYVDYLVRQEQYKDLLREARQQRIAKVFGRPTGRNWAVVTWSGAQSTKWSSTLKSAVLASSARIS